MLPIAPLAIKIIIDYKMQIFVFVNKSSIMMMEKMQCAKNAIHNVKLATVQLKKIVLHVNKAGH